MIPLAIPVISGNEKKYLLECIETNFVSTAGPFVSKFETEIAKVSGNESAVAVNSGTSALHLGLIAVGVKHNDLVILPDLTFIASANSIAYCGATPWLLDIDKDSWTLDPIHLEKSLQLHTERMEGQLIHKATKRRVAAIMPVYTLGCPADMDKIKAVAQKFNLPIVADAAAAIGATYKGQPIGKLCDFTTYSFNGNKTITSGGGGAIVAGKESELANVRHISTTARVGRDYIHDQIGYNYRMTNIEAAVGLGQIEKLDQFVASKKNIRAVYDKCIEGTKNFEKFPNPSWAESVCWFSGIVLKENKIDKQEFVLKTLQDNGIEARPFWRPISSQEVFKSAPKESTDYTTSLWKRIITLPSSTNITSEELAKVTEVLLKIDKEM